MFLFSQQNFVVKFKRSGCFYFPNIIHMPFINGGMSTYMCVDAVLCKLKKKTVK